MRTLLSYIVHHHRLKNCMMMELRQKSSPTREISLWKLTKAKEKRQQRETTHSKGKNISDMPHPFSVLKKFTGPFN